MKSGRRKTAALWMRRIGWLIAIWGGSIAVLSVVAYVLRLVMNAAGMTA